MQRQEMFIQRYSSAPQKSGIFRRNDSSSVDFSSSSSSSSSYYNYSYSNEGTTKNSHIGHCTPTVENANVA